MVKVADKYLFLEQGVLSVLALPSIFPEVQRDNTKVSEKCDCCS